MKLNREKKLAIVNALDISNPNGILMLIITKIQRVIQNYFGLPTASPPKYLVAEYAMDDEGLTQFRRDLESLDEIADDLCLYGDEETEDGEEYFDFNEDVISVPDLIRKHVTAEEGILSYDIDSIYNDLDEAVENYKSKVLTPLGGYYFYYRDSKNHEKCEYVFENLREHKWRFLNLLANDYPSITSPVRVIDKSEWGRIFTSCDVDSDEKDFNKAVREAKACPPFVVITHPRCTKPDEKFTIVQTLQDVKWDDLIAEYAEPYAFKKGPQYIAGNDITIEVAQRCGMPELAAEIERIEFLFLKDDEE